MRQVRLKAVPIWEKINLDLFNISVALFPSVPLKTQSFSIKYISPRKSELTSFGAFRINFFHLLLLFVTLHFGIEFFHRIVYMENLEVICPMKFASITLSDIFVTYIQ